MLTTAKPEYWITTTFFPGGSLTALLTPILSQNNSYHRTQTMLTAITAFTFIFARQTSVGLLPASDRPGLETLNNSSAELSHLLSLSGKPIGKEDIPKSELAMCENYYKAIVGSAIQAKGRRDWQGRKTKDFKDELILFTWQSQGQKWTWLDVDGSRALLFCEGRPSNIQSKTGSAEKAELVRWARSVLNYPDNLPGKLKFYEHGKAKIADSEFLHGYIAFEDIRQREIHLSPELDWIRSVVVWVGPKWICIQVPLPHRPNGNAPAATLASQRQKSRFDKQEVPANVLRDS